MGKEYTQRLHSLIKEHFGTQNNFSRLVGVSTATVSRVLAGAKPSNNFRSKLSYVVSSIDEIPEETKSYFQAPTMEKPFCFEKPGEILSDAARELLLKMEKQLSDQEAVLIDPSKKGSFEEVYEALFESLEEIKYSAGALSMARAEERAIEAGKAVEREILHFLENNRFFKKSGI